MGAASAHLFLIRNTYYVLRIACYVLRVAYCVFSTPPLQLSQAFVFSQPDFKNSKIRGSFFHPMSANLIPTQPHRNKPESLQVTRPSAKPLRRPDPGGAGKKAPPPDGGRVGCLRGLLRSPAVIAMLAVLLALFLVSAASAAVGWSLGSAEYNATATMDAGLYMLDQYNLALADVEAGNLSLARQRLEFIFAQNPNFLDVHQQLLQVLIAMGGSTQPVSGGGLPTQTATPTQDPRPKEELFAAAQALLAARDWTGTIDTLLSLRKTDVNFHTADVDGMLYAALRNRGAQNIIQLGLFEPGLYDFSLAEAFGPLDAEAESYRTWARLYLYGNAFWFAYPQDAAYYYGQAASLAPNLTDASGMSAFSRYWHSLIHWADQLAEDGDWCAAYEQYLVAIAARNDADLQAQANQAQAMCVGPTDTPSQIPSATSIPVFTSTPTFTGVPPSDTPGPTQTPSQTWTPTNTSVPSDTPLPPTNTPTETWTTAP